MYSNTIYTTFFLIPSHKKKKVAKLTIVTNPFHVTYEHVTLGTVFQKNERFIWRVVHYALYLCI